MKPLSFPSLLLGLLALLLSLPRLSAAEFDQRMVNLSTRGLVGIDASGMMITGFVVGEGAPKKILVRAIGPSLVPFGVSGVLDRPVITLFNAQGTQLTSNAGWADADAATMTSVGAFPLPSGSRDAAIVTTLSPGAYTAQVTTAGSTPGVALIEVYDVSGPARLINLSTRGTVSTNNINATLTAGLVVASGGGNRRVLVRAAGPALVPVGVSNAHPDPALVVLSASGQRVAANDNWGSDAEATVSAAFTQAGAFGFTAGSKDAALVTDLAPGNYTIQVTGASGTSGVALVEIYDLTPGDSNSGQTASLYLASLRAASGAPETTGYGTATIRLSADERSAVVGVSFANLSSPEVVAHLVLDGNFILGLPSGQIGDLIWNIAAVGRYSAADIVAALKSGRVTVQIDTAAHPAGELTGTFVRSTGGLFVTPATPPAVNLAQATPQGAARLLLQATFGPTQRDIDYVVQKGYRAWIDEQMTIPASSHRSATVADFSASNLGGQGAPVNGLYPYPGGVHRQAAWWKVVLGGQDLLRQRVAFALSELFVVSDQDANLNPWQEPLAAYYDMLARSAFGNYRQLLEDVTLSPVMGVYLSSLRNTSRMVDANGSEISSPDENYAREIMQLFSIGLFELNPDGTLRLDANGQPIPTYDQDTIVETAKVFTGWAFYSAQANPGFRTSGGTAVEDWIHPMMLYPEFHENSAKTIVGGKVLPAGQGGAKDLKDTLDALFNHPNTGPFVSRRLIQRLVTSNPSPGYVYRVAQVFANNGAGVRGDLAAVIRAILLDYEARSPEMISNPTFGKLKEPILRATHLLRAFGSKSDSGRLNIDAYPMLAQAALRSPTVFNFFMPDFTRPGTLAAAGLYAPEFQIHTDTTAITMANFYRFYLYNPKPAIPSVDNRESIYPTFDEFLPLARSPAALVDKLNLLFAAGTLSKTTTDRLTAALNELPASADDYARVQAAAYLVVVSPEGASQK